MEAKVKGLAAVLAGVLLSSPVWAQEAGSGQQEALERLQEDERERFQRNLDESYLPGQRAPKPEPPAADKDENERCFEIRRIVLKPLDNSAPRLRKLLQPAVKRREGQCLALSDIRALQRELGNRLIDAGFIASRVLVPRQSLQSGRLQLTLVPGRIEGFEPNALDPALLKLALPARPGEVLALPALEQAIENLNRIQGLDASLDIKPGHARGKSVVVANAGHGRWYSPSLILNQKFYGATAHTTGNMQLELGSPFGLTDRLIVKTNTDLDTAISDEAWGLGLDYDLGVGYWLFSAGFNRQAYSKEVEGTFQTFETSGTTDISRLEASRVLYRSGITRFTAGLLARYSDVRNQLENTTIRVSSYQLKSGGVRMDYNLRAGWWRLGSVLTWEAGSASGPASDLRGGFSVANRTYERTKFYLSALRPFSFWNGSARFQVNGQYSRDELFSSARFSLTAGVDGYEEVSFSGNTGATASLNLSANQQAGPFSLRPFMRWATGVIPGEMHERPFVKLSSMKTGVALNRAHLHIKLSAAWPVEQFSTDEARNARVVQAMLEWR